MEKGNKMEKERVDKTEWTYTDYYIVDIESKWMNIQWTHYTYDVRLSSCVSTYRHNI